MKKIIPSIFTIFAVVFVLTQATKAYFADQAVLGTNTFATGILEIRIDGQENKTGFNAINMAPGDQFEKVFSLSNFGPPHFAGPSTLAAKGLLASVVKTDGDLNLFNSLTAKLYNNAGWSGCSNPSVVFVAGKGCTVYDGLLKDLTNADILNATYWGTHPSLVPGNSFTMTMVVELPETHTDQSIMMGTSTTFDLNVDGYTNWPTP